MFSPRPPPIIFKGTEECCKILQKWLLEESKSRKNDMVMIENEHACNGIEANIVVHIYPEDCPECGICCEDPVIISRSTAMLIMVRYKRKLPCFHCQEAHEEVHEEANEEVHEEANGEVHEGIQEKTHDVEMGNSTSLYDTGHFKLCLGMLKRYKLGIALVLVVMAVVSIAIPALYYLTSTPYSKGEN